MVDEDETEHDLNLTDDEISKLIEEKLKDEVDPEHCDTFEFVWYRYASLLFNNISWSLKL